MEGRLDAVLAFTQEVRRLASHVAQRQENYAAVAKSLERLRHQSAAEGRGMPVDAGPGFPSAARAPPSSALMHAAYHSRQQDVTPIRTVSGCSALPPASDPASRSKHGRERNAHAHDLTDAVDRAESEQEIQLAKMLEEARMLRMTRSPVKTGAASARPGARAGASDHAAGKADKMPSDPGVLNCSKQDTRLHTRALLSKDSREGATLKVTDEENQGHDLLGAGANDALERILQQAREIAPLNEMGEVISGATLHQERGSKKHSTKQQISKVARVGTQAATVATSAGRIPLQAETLSSVAGPSRSAHASRMGSKEEKRDRRSSSREPAGMVNAHFVCKRYLA